MDFDIGIRNSWILNSAGGVAGVGQSVLAFRSSTSIPSLPALGDRYIAIGSSGGWTHNHIQYWNGSWIDVEPVPGSTVYVVATGALMFWNLLAGTWSPVSSSIAGPGASTNNAVVRWSGTSGAVLLNSTATLSDFGILDCVGVNFSGSRFLSAPSSTDTFVGSGAGLAAGNSTGVGYQALRSCTGSGNTALGSLAGSNYTTESGNIVIANTGTLGDNGIIRIGSSQTSAYLAGVYSASAGSTTRGVIIGSEGKLSTQTLFTGPNTSTSGAIATFANTSGNTVQNTGVIVSGAGISLPAGANFMINTGTVLSQRNTITNIAVGLNSGNPAGTAGNNVFVGYTSAPNITGGFNNTILGSDSGLVLTAGADNTFVGFNSGITTTTGIGNVFIGILAGRFNTTLNNNIAISSVCSASDNGIIRIGTAGTHGAAYLAGIYGQSPSTQPQAVMIGSDGKLSSAAMNYAIMRFAGQLTQTLTTSPVKLNITTSLDALSAGFTSTNNQLLYTGATRIFKITVSGFTQTVTAASTLTLIIGINGSAVVIPDRATITIPAGISTAFSITTIVSLVPSDFLELFGSVSTNTDIVISGTFTAVNIDA